jgi:DNA-binding MarR family transcriptional regulator
MEYDNLKLENQLCHRFYIATNAITRSYRLLLDALDLTYPQYVVLMALWEQDNVSISDILERTKIDGGSLSQILNKLVLKKLIQLNPSKEDKRKKQVLLTNKGQKLKVKSKEVPEAMSCKITSLDNDDILKLIELLDKINGDLQKD